MNLTERCVVLEDLVKHKLGLYQPGIGVIVLYSGLTVGEFALYL